MNPFVKTGIFSLLMGAALACGPALAQDRTLFVPTSGWLVGSATAVPAGPGAAFPCVMLNQYDNGYTIRISAAGGKALAVAIDFRQPAFTPGQHYPVALAVPPAPAQGLDATAYDPATLIVSLKDDNGFYKEIKAGQTMTVGVGDKTLEFALIGADEGLRRVEECYKKGSGAPDVSAYPMKQGAAGQTPSFATKVPSAPIMPAEALPASATSRVIEPAALPPEEAIATPQDLLPMPQQKRAGEAQDLIRTEKPRPGMTTNYRLAKNWSSPFKGDTPPSSDQARFEKLASSWQPAPEEREWQTLSGASLHETLDAWASRARILMVWDLQDDFPIAASKNYSGGFEDAVSGLLEDYGASTPRPVGKIYRHPRTGQKILLIESAGRS